MCLAPTVTSFSNGCRNREPVSLLLSWSGELRTKQLKLLSTGMYHLSDVQMIHKELEKLHLSKKEFRLNYIYLKLTVKWKQRLFVILLGCKALALCFKSTCLFGFCFHVSFPLLYTLNLIPSCAVFLAMSTLLPVMSSTGSHCSALLGETVMESSPARYFKFYF